MQKRVAERIAVGSVLLALCLLALAALRAAQPVAVPGVAAVLPTAFNGTPQPREEPGPRKPITIGVVADPYVPPFEERVARADLIVLGLVGEPYSSRWNTATGVLPPGTTSANLPPDATIHTDWQVKVRRVLKGSSAEETIRVRLWGGKAGRDSVTTNVMPRLRPGLEVIMLLSASERAGHDAHGPQHYGTSSHQTYEVRGRTARYRIMTEDSSPWRRVPLDDLLTRIEAARDLPSPVYPTVAPEPTRSP